MIYTIFQTLFFALVNRRKSILIICVALLVIVPSITIYFTVFYHHSKDIIKIQVSNVNMSHFDIRMDSIWYNIKISLDIYNFQKYEY